MKSLFPAMSEGLFTEKEVGYTKYTSSYQSAMGGIAQPASGDAQPLAVRTRN
jgi:hypothetical protein